VVGALIGVGFASQSSIKWSWQSGSVSQVAASWAIAPLIAAGFSALIFGTLKYGVLERKDSFKWAMRLIPLYLATTAAILALFIVVEAPTAPSLEDFGVGKAVGIILGVFFGCLAIAYIFFMPYFKRRLIAKDPRVKAWHLPLGPLLMRENPPLYFPGKADSKVYEGDDEDTASEMSAYANDKPGVHLASREDNSDNKDDHEITGLGAPIEGDSTALEKGPVQSQSRTQRRHIGPEERFLDPVKHLSYANPQRIWGITKFALLQGVTRDCVTHNGEQLRSIHAKANKYDPRVEHLWTYCQLASAMMMSIAHGSNDVAMNLTNWKECTQVHVRIQAVLQMSMMPPRLPLLSK